MRTILSRCSSAIVSGVAGLSLAAAAMHAQGATAGKPETIEVLFLGHNSQHHDSGRFAPMLKGALAPEGIDITYTADLNDLSAATLAKYDALIIYANHTKIAPEQEAALLEFVAGGKGFLPIHAASYCFQNSPAYIALVGARGHSAVSGVGRDVRPHEAQSRS
jgi:uncharacterized protein